MVANYTGCEIEYHGVKNNGARLYSSRVQVQSIRFYFGRESKTADSLPPSDVNVVSCTIQYIQVDPVVLMVI